VNYSEMINRCFWHNSVEEVMEALKKEDHHFAKACLASMEANSMTSMKLALQMLRKAKNMDYHQCLKMELDVCFNRIRDDEFDLGVKKIL